MVESFPDLIATVRTGIESDPPCEETPPFDPAHCVRCAALAALDSLAAGVFLTREEAVEITNLLNAGRHYRTADVLAARLSEATDG